MTTTQMEKMIESIVKEAARKLKAEFNELPPEMDATEALQQVVQAHMHDATVERLIRVAKQFGIPQEHGEGFRAHMKAVNTPTNDTKPITIKVEAENTFENRMLLARLNGEAINIYGSQMELPDSEEQEEDDGQEELDLEEGETDAV